ncbi:Sterol 3-beta-glucosyltransferase [Entomophthora muscae]|uniref:Sterol 3-beta-glucosyltransferase n=1 Tax=Entomophthora muscae TaxID=34485 RepID=A0ACC2RL96_9FUNG|nr:Sterol 3-beta-glucosyltransferase [Entomophthora muscae]
MVDLKTVVSIQLSKVRQFGFKICTPTKKYSLQTDSEVSLKEWVQALQRAVFRAKNSDHLKIVLPLKSVIDAELVQAFSFAHTLRLKTVESNFAIDDHHFVFFEEGQLAYDLIHQGIETAKQNSPAKGDEPDKKTESRSMAQSLSAPVKSLINNNSILRLVTRGRSASVSGPISVPDQEPPSSLSDSQEFHNVERGEESSDSRSAGWLKFPSLNKPQSEDSSLFSINAPLVDTFLPSEDAILSDFALADGEQALGSFGCLFLRVVPRWGRLVITERFLCFQSRIVGMAIKVLVPLTDLKTIERQPGLRLLHHGLSITTINAQELFMEFKSSKSRDQAITLLEQGLSTVTPKSPSHQKPQWIQDLDITDARLLSPTLVAGTPSPLHITCLTIGTRGDVQPYIALCKGLIKHGHTCRIATHSEYREWIESHGIEFREVAGDPGELIKLCVDNGMFSLSFLREGVTKFRGWIDELLESAWHACQGTDILLESPSAMAGIHIAERLDIPFFGSFPMPWTRTRAFPHPFAIPGHAIGGSYNYMTYVLIEQVLWKGIGYQVNRWRKHTLGLAPTDLDALQAHRVPFLYAFSPALVPLPADWHDWIHITGFWFLDDPMPGWSPSPDLVRFLEAGPPPIYIGFGSITVSDPEATIQAIVDAVTQANVRVIFCEGWSNRFATSVTPTEFPDSIFPIDSVPHDWLFPRVAGVVHHGGSGTTAAGLRAGVPTIIKPFFGDQYFWAQQVENMGAGVYLHRLTTFKLVSAFQAISDPKMIERAAAIGVQIRQENGVETAIKFMYRDLDYARNRLKKPSAEHSKISSPGLNDSQLLAQFSGLSSPVHKEESSEHENGWYLVANHDATSNELSPAATPKM